MPKVVMMFNLQWYNTYAAFIVPFTVSVFGIFLLRQFFMQIPRELYEAAVLDGVGHIGFLFRVVLPLSRPILMALGLLTFVWSWDNFKWPLLVTRDSSMRRHGGWPAAVHIGEGQGGRASHGVRYARGGASDRPVFHHSEILQGRDSDDRFQGVGIRQ